MSFRVNSNNNVVFNLPPTPLPSGQDTQILTNVNGTNMFSYSGYNFSASDMFPKDTTTTFRTDIPNINQGWWGGVLGPNGKIYTTPYMSNSTLILDPETETYTQQFINTPVNSGFVGGVCTNGKIYYLASSAVLVNDIFNNRFYNIDISYGSNTSGYFGCCLGVNGKIYGIPGNANNVLVLNPNDESYYFLTSSDISAAIGSKWAGGVLAPNGIIYCMPSIETFFLMINTNNDTISKLTNGPTLALTSGVSFGNKYIGGALAPNGKIYAMPYSNTGANTGIYVLEIDPSNNSYIDLSGSGTFSISGTRNYVGATCGFDGNIYSTLELGTQVLKINTSTTPVTMSRFGSISRTWGGVLAPNGKIYFNPRPNIGTSWTYIKTGIPSQQPWMLAPTFNKL